MLLCGFLLLSLGVSRALAAEGLAVYAEAFALLESETVVLGAYERDWQGSTYRPGERAYALAYAESGVRYRGWGLGRVWQRYQRLRFSESAARLYYRVQNSLPLSNAAPYAVDVRLRSFAANGLRVFASPVQTRRWRLSLGVTRLYAYDLLEGRLQGAVQANGPRDYTFQDLMLDYVYARDAVFDRQVRAPRGQGWAFDARIGWRPGPRLRLDLHLRDLAGRIDWFDAPHTAARVESDNRRYDENGYLRVDPTLSGRHDQLDYRQRLPWFGRLRLEAGSPSRAAVLEVVRSGVKSFVLLGLSRRLGGWWAQVLYRPDRRAPALRLARGGFSLGLASDALDWARARYLSIELGLRLTL